MPEQFLRLEERVERLVSACHDLREAKAALEVRVVDLEQRLKTKDLAEQGYLEEKSTIRTRVDNLLNKLDEVLASQ
jgi:hypothetical protein